MESAGTATWADLADLADLWDLADAEVGIQRGGERLVGSMTRPHEFDGPPGRPDGAVSGDPDRLVLAGRIDDVVVGFAYATVDRRPAHAVAVVEVLFVEAGARGVGVGEAMADEVLAWAVRQGCVGIDAYALPGNRSAKAFFEDSGFVTRLLTMHRPIPGREALDRG